MPHIGSHNLLLNRTFQYLGIILIVAAMGGGYWYWKNAKAAQTVTDNRPSFDAPLTHSLVLDHGTGNPTYTRATTAWEFDNEGKLITVPSGAARFGGARMVRNRLLASEDLTSASWTKTNTTIAAGVSDPDGGTTAFTITATAATGMLSQAPQEVIGQIASSSVWIRRRTGTGNVYLRSANGANTNIITVTGTWQRLQANSTATDAFIRYGVTLAVSGDAVDVWHPQQENVTGQADQTASEYVSVGVLSAPWHGAGVDGVKYFNTNKDATPISAANLSGYHAEGARTNNLLYSRDLRYTNWVRPLIGSELITNGTFDTDISGWTDASAAPGVISWSPSAKLQFDTLAGGNAKARATVLTTTVGKQYYVSYTSTGNLFMRVGTTVGGQDLLTETAVKSGYFTATSTTSYFELKTAGSVDITADDFSVKEAAIQVTTATGIDNTTSSASTLTAGATDATILQTLTLASAARSSSAYVKRRTGTGNVYFTRDGGTSWTDITSQINGSTWTRVTIGNTSVTDPSIGFKLATSGDAIDVDAVQDEAGAFASSPIITTTATVTRNDDALSYATAGNFSDTAGTCLVTATATERGIFANQGRLIGQAAATTILYYIPSGSNIRVGSWDGTSVGLSNTVASGPTSFKAASSWSGSAVKLSVNGGIGTAGTYDGTFGMSNLTIGGSNSHAFGFLKEVYIWKKALSDTELQNMTSTTEGIATSVIKKTTIANAPNNTGLVGYWSFEDGSGTQAEDFSPTGTNTGTLTNGPTWVDGKIGKAVNFDGTDDKVVGGNFTVPTTTTISAWVKKDTSTSQRSFFSNRAGAGRVYLGLKTTQIYLYDASAVPQGVESSAGSIQIGQWQHVVATSDGYTTKFYVNGSLVHTASQTRTSSTGSSFGIGWDPNLGTEYWGGEIDEVRIYNYALSASEVAGLYAQGSTGKTTVNSSQNNELTSGLVGLWSFNGPDLSGTTAYDRSGQGNNGTLTNGPTVYPGKVGQGLRFDGTDDYVTAGNNSNLNCPTTVAVSVWMKSTYDFGSVLNTFFGVVSRMQSPSPYSGYELGVGGNYISANNKAYFHAGGSYASNAVIGTTSINDGKWHNLVGVYDGTKSYIYVDGVLENSATKTNNLSLATENFDIGRNYSGSIRFSGSIDEVRIYDRALSAAEISALYQMGR